MSRFGFHDADRSEYLANNKTNRVGFWRSLRSRAYSTLDDPAEWLVRALGGGKTKSGIRISQSTALNISTVWSCVRVLSETCGTLPFILYERMKPRGRTRAIDHSLYEVLHDQPNPEMTAQTLKETITGHAATWGNGYAEIERNGFGDIKYLWPIPPNLVVPFRLKETGEIKYQITLPHGEQIILNADKMFHMPGLSYDGLVGYSVVHKARESLGLTAATEEFGSTFYEQGAHVGATLSHPQSLSDTAYNRLKEDIEEKSGLTNAHRLRILEEGMTYDQIGIPPNEAQFLDTRKFQAIEVCRWFRMVPHLVQILDNATYSNIEQQGIDFTVHTMSPWFTRWQQTVRWKLLNDEEKKIYFAEFLENALLKGDFKSRWEGYQIGRFSGILSGNDIRELENLNPIGPEGDIYTIQVSMVDLKELLIPSTDKEENGRQGGMRELRAAGRSRRRTIKAFNKVWRNAADRIVGPETKDVRRAARKFLSERSAEDFEQWLRDFYDRHPETVAKRFAPALNSMAEALVPISADEIGEELELDDALQDIVDSYLSRIANAYSSNSRGQLLSVMEEAIEKNEDPLKAIEQRLDEWDDKRAKKTADWRSVEAGGMIAVETWGILGVLKLRWNNSGKETCPWCKGLDGKVVGIRKGFLEKDEDYQPEDTNRPMKPATKIRHNPMHDGCDCWVSAEI